ncbi:MAG TPA: cyclic nucleotide-binding domain-containing protein [Acidimicrobiales bacterium]|nr:cyclic nucleotide-binding domain-containing protein [Acidimicrobiales bacterium]
MSSFFDYGNPTESHHSGFVLFAGRDPKDWETLIAAMERRRFRQGDTILEAGESDRSLYVLSDGTVEVLVAGRRGTKRTGIMETGAVFGEVAFFDGRPRSATVRALSDGELLRLGYDEWELLTARHPELGRALLLDLGSLMASRLRAIEQRL